MKRLCRNLGSSGNGKNHGFPVTSYGVIWATRVTVSGLESRACLALEIFGR